MSTTTAIPGAAAPPHHHVRALDGLRGIAILLVLADHLFAGDVRGVRGLDSLLRRTSEGWIGVDLFFVLSGFLITGILLGAKGGHGYFRSFYARRTLRVFPLYFGMLAAGWVTSRFTGERGVGSFRDEQVWLWTYLTNFRIGYLKYAPDFRAGIFAYAHFWSLAVEEHFHLVWPVLVWACPRRYFYGMCFGLAAACVAARFWYRLATGYVQNLYFVTPFRIDGLLLSAIRRCINPIALTATLVAAAYVTSAQLKSGWNLPFGFTAVLGYTIPAVCFASPVVCCAATEKPNLFRRLTEARVLTFMGVYSYGIYALHPTVVNAVRAPATRTRQRPPHSATTTDLGGNLVAGAVSVAAAAVDYDAYEVRFLRPKRLFPDARGVTAVATIDVA